MTPSPCLCGHPMHPRTTCAVCGCTVASPDYVAGSARQLERLSPEEAERWTASLRAASADVAAQLGHGREKRHEKACGYCGGVFWAIRPHAVTCCGACRQALSNARTYATLEDIPPPATRRDTFSAERQRATGYGLITASESYAADVRVVTARLREQG